MRPGRSRAREDFRRPAGSSKSIGEPGWKPPHPDRREAFYGKPLASLLKTSANPAVTRKQWSRIHRKDGQPAREIARLARDLHAAREFDTALFPTSSPAWLQLPQERACALPALPHGEYQYSP